MSVSPLRKPEKADEREAVVIRPAGPAQRAEARGRAAMIAGLPSRLPEGSPEGSPAAHAPSPAAGILVVLSDRAAALSRVSPVHWDPPRLSLLWERHAQAAECHDGSLWRALRYAWGVGHCTAAGTAYLLIAVAFSPAGFALAVALSVACWLWL